MSVPPKISNLDEATVFAFSSDCKNITEDVVGQASSDLMTAADSGKPNLVLDFSEVEFFGSSFIEVLFRVWQHLQDRGGRFVLCNLSPHCHEVLKTTNLDSLWPVLGSVQEAAASLQSPS